jgi:hypothetical protein
MLFFVLEAEAAHRQHPAAALSALMDDRHTYLPLVGLADATRLTPQLATCNVLSANHGLGECRPPNRSTLLNRNRRFARVAAR